jgi:putative molybdopterin biosynthesis protein
MLPIQSIHSFEQLKLLSDPRRQKILRLLMAAPASLTMLGEQLGQHPARIRHHLKALESAGLVELVETRSAAGVTEKFYRACASGWLLQELILPENSRRPTVVFSGSHDLAVELLASRLADACTLLTLPVGSLDGLVNLRQNLCHISGAHLLDPGGDYNRSFVNHIFPDRTMHLMTLAHREQGLMTAPGNPLSIRELEDLARPGIRFVNRNPGSGTRLWLDQALLARGIPTDGIQGYATAVRTHTESARRVHEGHADAAIGLRAAASQFGLHFIPLFQERYDLVSSQDQEGLLAPVFDALQSGVFRHSMENLSGYATAHTGETIPI